MELSMPIHEYVSVYTCAYTCTQAYFPKILLFNQFTTGKSAFREVECAALFFAHILLNFPAGLSGPPETAALFQTVRADLKQDSVFFIGRERFRGCFCLWYGNRNSQAVKSIMNKIEKFQGMQSVRAEQQKTSANHFAEHLCERCGILKISWCSVMSGTIHATSYFCTQEGKS